MTIKKEFHFHLGVLMDQRRRIVTCARELLGVRFRHQGRSRAGVDCLGLLLLVAAELGVLFEGMEVGAIDVPTYGMRPDTVLLQAKLMRFLVSVDLDAVMAGDVVLLRIQDSPQHLAILGDYPVTGELSMIHAYLPAGGVVEHRYDAVWRGVTQAAYRLPQLV